MATLIFELAATQHFPTHVGIPDVFAGLQPACFDHWAVRFVIGADTGFLVGEGFDERGTQRLECGAGSFEVPGLSESVGLFGNVGWEHFHVVAFDGFGDGGGVLVNAFG